jgi:radical SAM family uncharacterized protein/radical SAM-linked protein
MKSIDILKEAGNKLLNLRNPVRYVGGEFRYGERKTLEQHSVKVALCFPDLYEIGFSNNAIRILYDLIESMGSDIITDLVFSVENDFENFLIENNLPLYTLNYGLPLNNVDLLGVSVGYELAATNILQVLSLGNIALHADKREEGSPIVIAGGPAVTNPLPFSPFFDFIFIGEAEDGLTDVINVIKEYKNRGRKRAEIIEKLKEFPFLWHIGKKKAIRAIDKNFAKKEDSLYKHYIVPNFKVAQDNGVVEIMRGCPNGCRFCHAGEYYKPYRQKDYVDIKKEIEQNITQFGFREITLSSLSSGDHPQIKEMISALNTEYSPKNISFSLPSLKVSSFALDILEQLSEVRKSGLTFAIETPLPKWQNMINKNVEVEQVITIIKEAKKRGWRLAKFYFMIGLPKVDLDEEFVAIVSYLKEIATATQIAMNINIGTFIPKAHTPFQWAEQLNSEVALNHLINLKKAIQNEIKGSKVSYHDVWISYLEGIISRGDEKVALLIEQAFKNGCRLDAWNEFLNKEAWQKSFAELPIDFDHYIYKERSPKEKLPWDSVSLGVSKAYLRKEWQNALEGKTIERCYPNCPWPCGVCSKINEVKEVDSVIEQIPIEPKKVYKEVRPVIFTYEKKGKATFISHINVMRIFEQTFQRGQIDVAFTQGFNPKPRMEFVNPLTTGISGEAEYLLVNINDALKLDEQTVLKRLNEQSPEGFKFKAMKIIDTKAKTTLSKHHLGSIYQISNIENEQDLSKLNKLTEELTILKKLSDDTFILKLKGDSNPIKALFGNTENKFELLTRLNIHRKEILIDDNYAVTTSFGGM